MDAFNGVFYQVITILTFGFVIALFVWMPSKRDLRRLAARDAARDLGLRGQLERRCGETVTLVLDDMNAAVGAPELVGTLEDVDDEWVLVERAGAQEGARLVAVRLESIRALEEK